MSNTNTPDEFDFGAAILGQFSGERHAPSDNGSEATGAAERDLDAPPADLPPVPTPHQIAAMGADYTEGAGGIGLPGIVYSTRPELFHRMCEVIGDPDRVLGHLYRQGRSLVRVDDDGAAVLSADGLAAEAEKQISFSKRNAKGEVTPDLFPSPVANRLVSSPHLCENVRVLDGVTGVPLFRPDGSLMDTEGYDAATRYVWRPDDGIEISTPDVPSRDDVAEAVRLVLEPIRGFPFVSNADRNAWIGMALTPLLRFIAPGPYKLGLIEAHQAGSGKSFLASMLAELHSGQTHAEMPREDAEIRKKVTSALQQKGGLIVFDNVDGKLASPVLAGLLTTREWSDRLLGRNTNVTLPNDRFWVVTGNNITIDGDMARRVLRCVIDPGMPNPELREFDFNPVDWIREHRSEYLSALMTLVRAWVCAGRPEGSSPGSDSYGTWRKAIDGLLGVVGLEGGFDPQENRVVMGKSDEEWGVFLEAVHLVMGNSVWRMSEVVDAIEAGRIDAELLPGGLAAKWSGWATAGFSKSLGRWAMHRTGKWVGDYQMQDAGMHRTKTRQWRVVVRGSERGLNPRPVRVRPQNAGLEPKNAGLGTEVPNPVLTLWCENVCMYIYLEKYVRVQDMQGLFL